MQPASDSAWFSSLHTAQTRQAAHSARSESGSAPVHPSDQARVIGRDKIAVTRAGTRLRSSGCRKALRPIWLTTVFVSTPSRRYGRVHLLCLLAGPMGRRSATALQMVCRPGGKVEPGAAGDAEGARANGLGVTSGAEGNGAGCSQPGAGAPRQGVSAAGGANSADRTDTTAPAHCRSVRRPSRERARAPGAGSSGADTSRRRSGAPASAAAT
jgi:hypothetical protein